MPQSEPPATAADPASAVDAPVAASPAAGPIEAPQAVNAVTAVGAEIAADITAYVLDNHIGFLLRRAHQRHAAVFNEMAAHVDLTPTQFAALVKTVQLGRVTQNHLGRLTAMDPATIQGVVRRLTERGFITRDIDPLDRRSAVLAPTVTAVEAAAAMLPTVRAITARIMEPLNPAEQAQLAQLLARIG